MIAWKARAAAAVIFVMLAAIIQSGCGAAKSQSGMKPGQLAAPKLDSDQLFQRRVECAKLGRQVVKDLNDISKEEELEANAKGSFWPEPVYGYSESINSCLVATGYWAFYGHGTSNRKGKSDEESTVSARKGVGLRSQNH